MTCGSGSSIAIPLLGVRITAHATRTSADAPCLTLKRAGSAQGPLQAQCCGGRLLWARNSTTATTSDADVRRAAEIIERYADLMIGLADASIVVLAERLGVQDLLTLDERHFRAVLGPHDKPFRLLPADA